MCGGWLPFFLSAIAVNFPEMPTWKSVILLLAAGQGFLLSLALMTPRVKSSRSNVFLGLIVLIFAFELLNDWAIQVRYHSTANAIPFWLLESYLIVPVALWFFVQLNTNASYTFRKNQLLLFVPALIEIITESYVHFVHRYSGFSLLSNNFWFLFTEVVPPVAIALVLVFYVISLSRLRKHYTFSTSATNTVQWVKLYGMLAVFVMLGFLWLLEVLLYLPVYHFVEYLLIGFILSLGYVAFFQPDFFNIPGFIKARSDIAGFARYNDRDELGRLEQMFSKEKLHRQPKLSLEEVASLMKLPDRYVSHLINVYHNDNFSHYVNGWRVKDVLEKINDPTEQHKTLLALALECGFNSKSSFNQIFKTHTGKTPSEYLPAKA